MIPYLLWEPNVRYRDRRGPPLNPAQSQLSQVYTPHPTPLYTILILVSTLRLGIRMQSLPVPIFD
jgi:hypothetical protein